MRNWALACLAAAWIVVAAAPPAYAQDYAAAGQHVAAAKEAYGKGAFVAAAEEYAKAYDIAKDPVLLANIAACNERGGKLELAVKNYRRYLADATGAADRSEIEKRIAELQKKLAEPAAPAPPPAPVPAALPAPMPAPVPVAAAPVAATGATSAPVTRVEAAPIVDKAAPEKDPEAIWKEADAQAAAARRAFEAKLAASSSAKLKGKAAKKALAEVAAAEADWKIADAKAEEARQTLVAWKLEQIRKAEEAKRAEDAKRAEAARVAEEARVAAAAKQAEEARRAEEEKRRVAEAKRLADLGPPMSFLIDDRGSKYRTAAWVTVAATVALVGAGIVFGLVAQDRSDEVSRRLSAVGANGQPPVFDAAMKQTLTELKHDGQTYDAVAIGLLSVAGLTAITSVILFAVDHRILTRAEKRVQLAPSFASGRAGVAAGFLF